MRKSSLIPPIPVRGGGGGGISLTSGAIGRGRPMYMWWTKQQDSKTITKLKYMIVLYSTKLTNSKDDYSVRTDTR